MKSPGEIDFEEIWRRRRGRPRVVTSRGGRRRSRHPVLWSLLAALVAIVVIGNWLLGLRVNYLFFVSVDHTNVFWTPLISQIVLFVIGFVVVGALVAVNIPAWLRIARNIDEASRTPVLIGGVVLTLLVAIACGASFASDWQDVLAWMHGHSFGIADPVFHMDASFYVFTLPFIDDVVGLAWAAVLIPLLVALAAFVLSAVAMAAPEEIPLPLTPAVGGSFATARAISARAVGVLMVFVFLLSAVGAHLTVFHMTTSVNTDYNFAGLDATQLGVDRPVLGALQWIAVAAALITAAIVARYWRGDRAIALGGGTAGLTALWLVVNLVLQTVPPLIYSGAVVTPNAQSEESGPINTYLSMSRQAWGLTSANVEAGDFGTPVAPTLSDLAADPGTLNNVRIQDTVELPDTLSQIDKTRNYQVFDHITVDRYATANGGEQEVMLSPREIQVSQVPNGSFVSQNEIYTHGYGVSAVSVSQVTGSGKPEILVGGQPMAQEISGSPPALSFDGQAGPIGGVGDPRIYCGFDTTQPVVVNTTQSEFDYLSSSGDHTSHAGSVDGIPVTNEIDKLALAINDFGSSFFLTDSLTSSSQVLLHRTIADRVQTIAPFLTVDSDPYVVVDPQTNNLMYIADAYVSTDNFPDSDQVNGVDYMRNAVKAVVNARTCQTTLYMVDPQEPLTATYNAIYPGLMKPLSDMPMFLRQHLRYPEDLFQDQSQVYAQVHVPNATVYFNSSDRWQLAQQLSGQSTVSTAPYYVEATLPCPTSTPNCTRAPSFVLLQTFSPANTSGSGTGSANNMTAWLAAECDYTGSALPKLVSVDLNNGDNVLGPLQFDNNINTNPTISAEISLLGRGGSTVVLGNVIVLPFNNHSFLYIRPLYVEASGNSGSNFPQLQYVIVGDQNAVSYGTSLTTALQSLFNTTAPIPGLNVSPGQTGSQTGPTTTPTPTPTPTPSPTGTGAERVPAGTRALIAELLSHEAQANAALRAGNFALFGQQEALVQSESAQLQRLLSESTGVTATPTATPAPTPSASTSPSPTGG